MNPEQPESSPSQASALQALSPSDIDSAAKRIRNLCQALPDEYKDTLVTMRLNNDQQGIEAIETAISKTSRSLTYAQTTMIPLEKPESVEDVRGSESLDSVAAMWKYHHTLIDTFGKTKQEIDDEISDSN